MQTLATIAPLIILLPSIGAFINFFWGPKLSEKMAAIIGSVASGATFIVALVLLNYLNGNFYQPAIVNPPLLDGWLRIPSIGLEIPWQQRIDTLSVTMMLFVSFVGTLIHIYAAGYMHGDARFARFFAYLNMFMAFMFILITGNNLLMMFVGWEGVGLSSYLLIGFWWDKKNGEGIKNANAARKAFIANRIGDFGVLMAIFLTFWAFGTLDFYRPTEVTSPHMMEALVAGGDHGEESAPAGEEGTDDHSGTAAQTVSLASDLSFAAEDPVAGEGHSGPTAPNHVNNDHLTYSELGIFAKAEARLKLAEGETLDVGDGTTIGRDVQIGSLTLDIDIVITLITLFLLLGAAGKSAQIPLFVWLPDAMAGPTPVSALIHAATMVTAGVYIMVRCNVFFYHAELSSFVVAIIGAATALVAGFIAMGQFDIKRVLAYSTVSQLGFMVAAVGIGAYGAAIFHMITHAFFKALLFLGSGSVIHGMEHGHHHAHEHAKHDSHGDAGHHDDHFDPQDMRTMGGLRRRMPITYATYLIGTLALAGIPIFAGFWSKDEILADAWIAGVFDGKLSGYIVLAVLLPAAAMTAFYMWRQVTMVFFGEPRHDAADYASESPWQMTVPLVILAILSIFGGFINIPGGANALALGLQGIFGLHTLSTFLEYSVAKLHVGEFQPLIALIATGLGVAAMFLARSIYGGNRAVNAEGKDPLEANPAFRPIWKVSNARMYWDEFYSAVFIVPFQRAARFLADVVDWNFLHDYFHDSLITRGFNGMGRILSQPVDLGIIDGSVRGLGRLVQAASGFMRRAQSGYVRVYAVALLIGVIAVVVLMLLPILRG